MLRIRREVIVLPSLIQQRENQLGLSHTPFNLPESHIIPYYCVLLDKLYATVDELYLWVELTNEVVEAVTVI